MDKNTKLVMFSSKTGEWATPQEFFNKLDWRFGPFDLDPCAAITNTKCANFFTEAEDGLSKSWEGFSSFIDTGREMVECDSSKSRAVDIGRMQCTQESEAEAHNLAIIWHLFREKLLEFLRIPGDSKPLFKGSHRMKDSEIGQVEIDGTIAWIERQSQGRIILETKGNRSYSRGWDVGFSTHQLIRPFRLLTLKTEEHRLPCEITPVFCRFEEGEDGQTWNALLDVYEIRADDTISWQRGIDFTGIPSQ